MTDTGELGLNERKTPFEQIHEAISVRVRTSQVMNFKLQVTAVMQVRPPRRLVWRETSGC